MKKDLHSLDEYTIVLEDGLQKDDAVINPSQDIIGIVYYLSGDVNINITEGGNKLNFSKSTGMMSAFFSSQDNHIVQSSNPNSELKKLSIFLSRNKLKELSEQDENLRKSEVIQKLINPQEHFVHGLKGFISPMSQQFLDYFFNTKLTGTPGKMAMESFTIGLLAEFLDSSTKIIQNNKLQIEKLHFAKEIILDQMDAPPSIQELSRLAGMNAYNLKTGFKELFGQPVFKFLQNKRLEKAFSLLENKDMTVQEVAWYVGYNSLGSFSNAFKAKFGIRPSDIAQ